MSGDDTGNIIHMGNKFLWTTLIKEGADGTKFSIKYTLDFTEIEETDLVCILDAIFSGRNVCLTYLKNCKLMQITKSIVEGKND